MVNHGLIPMSRQSILNFSQAVRRALHIADTEPFVDVVRILEHIIPSLYPDFTLEVLAKCEMGDDHGLTFPKRHLILLREDVYEGACRGKGRDRFTVAHEIGHLLMHEDIDPRYARREDGVDIPRYLDPEWQSDAFAGYFLMSPNAIVGLDARQVAAACGVSPEAARVQLSVIKK